MDARAATDRSFNMAVSFQDWSWARKTGLGGNPVSFIGTFCSVSICRRGRERGSCPVKKNLHRKAGRYSPGGMRLTQTVWGGKNEAAAITVPAGSAIYQIRLIASAKTPSLCLSPRKLALASLHLSVSASASGCGWERGPQNYSLRVIQASLLPVRTRLRVRQQKMQARQGVLARRRTG